MRWDERFTIRTKEELKRLGSYRKGGNTGFDGTMGRLMSGCYVVINDFVYMNQKKVLTKE